jgi:hypothetical protein
VGSPSPASKCLEVILYWQIDSTELAGEVLHRGVPFRKHDYQASVNAYRDSLAGDGDPVWTKVWSHIQMGKIFDITSQRKRAVAQYQLANQTGDNTDGEINQARELLEHPFEWPANQ